MTSPHQPYTPPEPVRSTDYARLALTRFTVGPDATLADAFHLACEAGAETMRVARAAVWLLIDEGQVLRCANLYERDTREHARGAQFKVADVPRYIQALRLRKTLPAEAAQTDPRTSELADLYLAPLGITSLLDAPIVVGGELMGVVCFEHIGTPREWSTEERDFAGSVADLLALKIRAAEVAELQALLHHHEVRASAINKAEALAQLAAGVAHDFGSLLTVIAGSAHLVRHRPELPEALHRDLDIIEDAAVRGAALVAELRRLGKGDANATTLVDVGAAVCDALPLLRAAAGTTHTIGFVAAPTICKALIDRHRLSRIVLNLVTNALESMPDGGHVDVSVAANAAEEVPGDGEAQYIVLTVTDRGAGIAADQLERVFDPYVTTKEGGTGLGLAIVRTFVEQAGGFIRVSSAPGEGTTVRVLLPRVAGGTSAAGL